MRNEQPMRIRSFIASVLALSVLLFPCCGVAAEKTYKITVTGGLLTGEPTVTTTKSGLHGGDEVGVYIDSSKIYDKNQNEINAFANWTYTPATVDLGKGFDPFSPEVTVTMPNADVKLTANFVNGFGASIYCGGSYMDGDAGGTPEGEFYWSVDNGKTLIPFGRSYPVKPGTVTVKFYDKTGNWCAGDWMYTVEKRGTYKEDGVTYYYDPAYFELSAVRFVPVKNSTVVKLDANGGSGPKETFQVDGYPYGALPMPSRKGYAFAGWWTQKDGGEHITEEKYFLAADFAGQKTPTIYAHWLQLRKLTMKDDSAYAEWSLDAAIFEDDQQLFSEIKSSYYRAHPDLEDDGYLYGYLEGKGVLEVLPGAQVSVEVDEYNEKNLMFQKWTVSPSKSDMGPTFLVALPETEFTMPTEDVTLQATYIDGSTCGRASAWAYASSIDIGWDEEAGEYATVEPPVGAFEWSPDGGKTWYKASQDGVDYYAPEALLKAGSYTITWRSTDPQWVTAEDKQKIKVVAGSYSSYVSATFTYVPQVVVDVMTIDGSMCGPSSAGGTATMNPKDGLVPSRKTITLTAKAAKDYAFQGWAFAKNWEYGNWFRNTDATWKIENLPAVSACSYTDSWLYGYIDPADRKVHVVAVFKAVSAYSADDIDFRGFEGSEASSEVDGNGETTVKAVVGCALDDDFELVCGPLASPLTYKLEGKLPDGLKFDTKTGVLSGAPKKVGKSSVTITAIDPAKNSKGIKVNFEVIELPGWLAGEFRGSVEVEGGYTDGYWQWDDDAQDDIWVDGEYAPGRQEGVLELSVKSDGKVSAKVATRIGTRSVSGTLTWLPGDDENPEGEFLFWHTDKDESYCHVYFYPDGTIDGDVDSYDKTEGEYVGGDMEGMRQDAELLAESPFLDKYYTFAFCATTTGYDESEMQSGYGYLTIKTDKKGVAKVSGQLPDGEKVSMGALVMPFAYETTEGMGARLYLFASPSSYKKLDWFAMTLAIDDDGVISSEDGAAWTPADIAGGGGLCVDARSQNAQVTGDGALYSEADSLENYYWTAFCAYSSNVRQEYAHKEAYKDEETGRTMYETVYDDAYAYDFGGYLFSVEVKGDKKGTISLDKSPAPWVDNGEWNFKSDKKGNPITDPSQLSISFTKATGIFTGKASVYFDEPKPTTASLPYSGVMIYDGKGYAGLGSAVHTYKYTYWDDNDRAKTATEKITLPVSLESAPVDEP